MMVISELNEGEVGIIEDIKTSHNTKIKLNNFGLIKGVKVKVIRKGALSGPLLIALKNSRLSIRQSVARNILVVKVYG